MSFDRLIEKIVEKQNPTVAGLLCSAEHKIRLLRKVRQNP